MSREKHFQGKITAKAVVVPPFEHVVMIVKPPNGRWELPGGRVNVGESLETALIRELREELTEAEYRTPQFLLSEQCLHSNSGTVQMSVTFVVSLRSVGRPDVADHGFEARWIGEKEFRSMPSETFYPNCWNALDSYFRRFVR